MGVKFHFASFQPGPAVFLFFKFPLLLLNCSFNDLRIKPDCPGRLDQIFMPDSVLIFIFSARRMMRLTSSLLYCLDDISFIVDNLNYFNFAVLANGSKIV